MREIPASIRSLLKSRAMVGADAPNMRISFRTDTAGQVQKTFNIDDISSGIGWHGPTRSLFVTYNLSPGVVKQYNSDDGALLDSWQIDDTPNGADVDRSDHDVFWATHGTAGWSKYSIANKTKTATFTLPSGIGEANGVAAPMGDYLWIGDSGNNQVHKVRKSDGAVVASYPTGITTSGVAWDGQFVWVSDVYSSVIKAIDPGSGSVVDQFNGPGSSHPGLTWDGEALWTVDDTNDDAVRFLGVDLPVQPSTLRISRDSAALAQRLTASWPNVNPGDPSDRGYYSPDRGDDVPANKNEWYRVIMPGRDVRASAGYGDEVVQVFKGAIDDVTLNVEPEASVIEIDCRDEGWKLIDRAVTDGAGNYTISYTDTEVADIAADLFQRAGFTDITTEATGLTVTKTFERQTYADALEWCMNITGFELTINELGAASFYYPTDRQPEITGLEVTLSGTTPVTITGGTGQGRAPIVSGSEVVKNSAGTVTYQRAVDYNIDYGSPESEATLARISGGAIADGETVRVDYVYAAYTFREGEDLFRLPYTISRRDIYGKIRVIGEKEDGSPAVGTYTYSGEISVPADKVLFEEIRELSTDTAAQAAANQLGNDMSRRHREIAFAAVGVPWLQVGDCVQVIESSTTISEIYRILTMDLSWEGGALIMACTAYHYGYAPL